MSGLTLTVHGAEQVMRRLDAVDKALQETALIEGLTAGAYVVERWAKIYSRIDLGFMRSSIYVKTPKMSGYAAAKQEAQALADRVFLPEAQLPDVGNDEEVVIIACGAEYGVHQEYITFRHKGLQPFMRPALYNHVPEIEKAFNHHVLRAIEDALK